MTPTTSRRGVPVTSSRVWSGDDAAGSDGIFLADLVQPLATGATSPCPLTNPCRIATVSATSIYETGPKIDGTRVVWSARTGAGEDKEIHLFDATRPADAAPPLACPLSNPCLLTENDRADSEPIVSASLVAWAQCEGADCLSFPTDRLVFNDGAQTIEVAGEWAGVPVAIEGTRVAWAAPSRSWPRQGAAETPPQPDFTRMIPYRIGRPERIRIGAVPYLPY